jgi:hypothetical protein
MGLINFKLPRVDWVADFEVNLLLKVFDQARLYLSRPIASWCLNRLSMYLSFNCYGTWRLSHLEIFSLDNLFFRIFDNPSLISETTEEMMFCEKGDCFM